MENFTTRLNDYFRSKVDVPRIMRVESQEIETLINEEALLLARFLKDKTGNWTPRVAIPKAF